MKYKEQALSKVEKLENQLRLLEMSINRSLPLDRIQHTISDIKDVIESLRGILSIEHDEWN